MKQIVILLSNRGEKLSFKNDNLIITDTEGKIKHQSTCYRLFSVFVIGHSSITTGLLQRARKFGFSLIFMSPTFRITGTWPSRTEGNVLLRKRQYEYKGLEIAQRLVANKIDSQMHVLKSIRSKTELLKSSIENLNLYRKRLPNPHLGFKEILGIEGVASREYFRGLYKNFDWTARRPRVKHDPVNCLLDIGYTMLFNFVEGLLNIYGFDAYCGVYHRQFYQRKSLVCDLVEPFRPIIDSRIRKALNLNQVHLDDFVIEQGQYKLFGSKSKLYIEWLLEVMLERREDMFLYVQQYYRAFTRNKSIEDYPYFYM